MGRVEAVVNTVVTGEFGSQPRRKFFLGIRAHESESNTAEPGGGVHETESGFEEIGGDEDDVFHWRVILLYGGRITLRASGSVILLRCLCP